jgi:DNA (cytosine-5)-methyltransferase 1
LGWSVAGYEKDQDTRRTRAFNGLFTEGSDVRNVKGSDGSWDLEIASPPCDAFSTGGLLQARKVISIIMSAVHQYAIGWPVPYDELERATGVEGAALVLEPLRVLLDSDARVAVWEQVESVLPIWQAGAQVLRARGWSVATGVLRAEEFGVPQIRRRAILVARRDGLSASLPAATHSPYNRSTPGSLALGAKPWVSQGEALGLTGYIGFPRRADRPDPDQRITIEGIDYRARDLRSTALPSQTITEKARSWSVFAEGEPRRPLTLDEAKALQTFPPGFDLAGSRTSQFRQVAMAVPPTLARAILSPLLPRGEDLG